MATLYIFGLKRGVGAESISEFFCRLRLESHVGCAPSALRGVMDVVEQAILETTAAWEQEGIAHGETRPIIGAVDETFVARMMLVCMDLVSGYLLFEEVAKERRYDTWHTLVKARLETLGVRVFSLVSDRAKALIKLAETGLECGSIPALFHLLHDLGKSYSLAIYSRLRQAQQALVETSDAEGKRWQRVHSASRQHLETLSLLLHPWRLVDAARQRSHEVERQTVQHQVALTPAWRQWSEELLLPRMSWQA